MSPEALNFLPSMSVRFQDPHCKGILNAVIYCSVLKGFTREKNAGKVWSVYEARQSACMSELFLSLDVF